MNLLLIIPFLLSLSLVITGMPKWIKKCNEVKYLWKDMNKYQGEINVAASGGFVVVISFVLGILSYIGIRNFIGIDSRVTMSIFGLLSVIMILAFVGLMDDILGWKQKGLSIKFRLFCAFISSIPLIIINSGVHTMDFPFVGLVNLGIIYILLLIPLGVVGVTTTYNFLAGFNGLETGQGIIILIFLSFVSYMTGSSWLALVGLIMVLPLIVFYFYNKFPAKVFPGDVLTYPIGALIVCMAILGNFEKIAFFIFIPYIFETILKSRGKLKKESFGKPNEDGSLDMPYKKIYGLTHLSIWILKKFKRKVYEKDVTYLIFSFQIIVCILALIIFRGGIF